MRHRFKVRFLLTHDAMGWRVTGYWLTPRVFGSKAAYNFAVVYRCEATDMLWLQGCTVRKGTDGRYYSKQEFIDWFREVDGPRLWDLAWFACKKDKWDNCPGENPRGKYQ